jgi:hypothetical protein
MKVSFGHKDRHGSFFLTALGLPVKEDIESFVGELGVGMQEEVRKQNPYHAFPVSIRLHEVKANGVLLVWWGYRTSDTDPIYGYHDGLDDDSSNGHTWDMQYWADNVIQRMLKDRGYEPHRKEHACYVEVN